MRAPTLLLVLAAAAVPAVGRAGEDGWATFVERAAEEHGAFGRRCAEFLAAHRPARDADLESGFLLENLRLALATRSEFPWGKTLPEERFLNDVLPYAVLDETRDPWRSAFHAAAARIVEDCKTPTEAAQALNREFFDHVGVHYDTGRKKPNQSPAESIEQGRASCTGLSILLVDACRSVGVPARVAGTPLWADKRGNHTWVEIWDGRWFFTGADEFDAAGLDRAWFGKAASQAVADDWRHAIWATSWRRTGSHFPLVWDLTNRDVSAVNVTARYTAGRTEAAPNVATVGLRVFDGAGGRRMVVRADLLDPLGRQLQSVETRAGRADLNDLAELTLTPGKDYLLRLRRGTEERSTGLRADAAGTATRDLVWQDLERGSVALRMADAWLALPREERSGAIPAIALTAGEAEEVVRRLIASRDALREGSGNAASGSGPEPPERRRIVWTDGPAAGRGGWWSVPEGTAREGEVIEARVSGQAISVDVPDGRSAITLWLRDRVVDLEEPIEVSVNERLVYRGTVERSVTAIHRSLLSSPAPDDAATAILELRW